MGILSSIIEHRSSTLANPDQWLIEALTGGKAESGIVVNDENALKYNALWACVRVISETVASQPLITYRRLERGKERAPSHPLYRLLHDEPNPEMTSFTFRETMTSHILLWGNAYAQIVRNRAGEVVELWPIHPNRVTMRRIDGRLVYEVQLDNGKKAQLEYPEVLHVLGLSPDGIQGYSVVRMARESIGLGLAAEKFGARFFGSGGKPASGYLKHPGKIKQGGVEAIRKAWHAQVGGENSHQVAVLQEGMEYVPINIPPEDAQFIETRKFQPVEICRWFRMQPHKIQILDRATFSNIEQQAIEHAVDTIRPWNVRWEQELNRALIPPEDRGTYFVEHLMDGLLRGDSESRHKAYMTGFQIGMYSPNDLLELENKNGYEGGDRRFVPLNMVPVDQLDSFQDNNERQRPRGETRSTRAAEDRRRLRESYRPVFLDFAKRILRRERADIMRKAEKVFGGRSAGDIDVFLSWLDDFYRDFPEYAVKQAYPAYRSFTEAVNASAAAQIGASAASEEQLDQWASEHVGRFGRGYPITSKSRLRAVLLRAQENGDDPLTALEAQFDSWTDSRPERTYKHSTVCLVGAIAGATWKMGGVVYERWVAAPNACPICSEMDGAVTAIEGSFASEGDVLEADEQQGPVEISRDILHPPLHSGCECDVAPEIS